MSKENNGKNERILVSLLAILPSVPLDVII